MKEAMDAVLMKYRGRNGEYLVLDTSNNSLQLDAHAARTICSRNFGVGSMGVLVGNAAKSADEMKWFDPQGALTEMSEDAKSVAESCAQDVQRHCTNWSEPRSGGKAPYLMGKIFLTEKFIVSNHLCMG